jgi:hypothetical protein
MLCKVCKVLMSKAEQAIYLTRCEDCWASARVYVSALPTVALPVVAKSVEPKRKVVKFRSK